MINQKEKMKYTVVGYSIKHGKKLTNAQASVLGKKSKKYCDENGFEWSEVPHERWDKVKTYPEEVLDITVKPFLDTL